MAHGAGEGIVRRPSLDAHMLDSHRVGGSDDEVNTGTPSTRIVARRAGRRAIIAPDVRQGFAGAVRVSGGSRCPNGASACRGAAWTVRLHCLLRLCDLRMADVSDCGAWSPSPPEIVAADVVSRSTTAEPCIVLLRYYSASGTSTCSASHQRSAARTPSIHGIHPNGCGNGRWYLGVFAIEPRSVVFAIMGVRP